MAKNNLTNRQALNLLIENLEEIQWILNIIKYNSLNSKADGPWTYYWPRIDKSMKTVGFMWRYIS